MPNDQPEKFSGKKFFRGLNPFSLVEWAKALVYTFRTVIILGVIVGLVVGVSYWQGRKNAPVQVDMADTLIILKNGDGKEHKLEIKDGIMKFDGRSIKVADIPSLKPYGIELHPKAIAGITTAGTPTAGLGLEFAHFYRFNADLLALYQFLGVGISYDLKLDGPIKIDNSSIGLGIGRDFESGGNAAIIYFGLDF